MAKTKGDCRPWYPFYPKDFSTDQNVLMLSEKGELVYRRILDALWLSKGCRIKDNPDVIFSLSCKDLGREFFDQGWSELEAVDMFTKHNGFIIQPRLLRHYNECVEQAERNRINAFKRWKKDK